MTAPERVYYDPRDGYISGNLPPDHPAFKSCVEYVRADLAAVPAQGREHEQDLIIRDLTMMLIRASRHVPDDQMEGVFDYMRRKGIDHGPLRAVIEPQPDPRDEVIARLVGALDTGIRQYRTDRTVNSAFYDDARAALAAAKEHAPTEYERKVSQMKNDFPNGI